MFEPSTLLIILGGMIGSVCRYLITWFCTHKYKSFFPYGTLLVNLLGSFLIGFLVSLDSLSISTDWLNGIIIGGLGGLTTFSTFQLEVWQMLQQNKWRVALGYWLSAPVLGLTCTELGIWLGDQF